MKENVFPTRRSVVATFSLNNTKNSLNTHFLQQFYPTSIKIYAVVVKKGKKFFLICSRTKHNGMVSFFANNAGCGFQNVGRKAFEELRANSDIMRYETKQVKTSLGKGFKVFKLSPYAVDGVKSVEFYNFKILKS